MTDKQAEYTSPEKAAMRHPGIALGIFTAAIGAFIVTASFVDNWAGDAAKVVQRGIR